MLILCLFTIMMIAAFIFGGLFMATMIAMLIPAIKFAAFVGFIYFLWKFLAD